MIIYRLTDRIPVEIGEVKFWLSPLSYSQKVVLAELYQMKAGVEHQDTHRAVLLSIKYSVKGVEGIKQSDGSDYALSFDADGTLSDQCVQELLGIDQAKQLVDACQYLSLVIKEHQIEGVRIDLAGVKDSKKNAV
jgi:hypothetical protein